MANLLRSGGYNVFKLKHSHHATVFQLFVFIIIGFALFRILNFYLSFFFCILGIVIWWLYFQQIRAEQIEYLEDNKWSLKYSKSQEIERVELKKIIDHHFYIVFYFSNVTTKSIVIWADQLSKKEWKMLKVRVNL